MLAGVAVIVIIVIPRAIFIKTSPHSLTHEKLPHHFEEIC